MIIWTILKLVSPDTLNNMAALMGNLQSSLSSIHIMMLYDVKTIYLFTTNNFQQGWPDRKTKMFIVHFALSPSWYDVLTLCLWFQIYSSSCLYAGFRTSSFQGNWLELSPSRYLIVMVHKYHDTCRYTNMLLWCDEINGFFTYTMTPPSHGFNLHRN